MPTIRDALCAQRAAIEAIDRELADAERQLASRNTAHLVSRARSLLAAGQELLSQALRHPLEPAAELVEEQAL